MLKERLGRCAFPERYYVYVVVVALFLIFETSPGRTLQCPRMSWHLVGRESQLHILHVSFLIHDFLATRSTTATAVAAEALVAVTGQREIASRRLAGT